MNYWLATHWPVPEDDPPGNPTGVHIAKGREDGVRELKPGDRVLIYETKTGGTKVVEDDEGPPRRVKPRPGRQGIVALVKVSGRLRRRSGSRPSKYVGRKPIHWLWHAGTKALNENGFVPRAAVNRTLGFSLRYCLRGLGKNSCGLRQLKEAEFKRLRRLFKKRRPIPPPGNTKLRQS